MKKINLMLVVVCALVLGTITANAQVCNIDAQYTVPGLYPSPDSIDCLVGGGAWNDVTVQFVNFDSVDNPVGSGRIRIEYIIIDSILNLPCGIKWSSSAQDASTPHKFLNQEKGCIRFWGATSDAVGQYELVVKVLARTSLIAIDVPYSAGDLGFDVYIRVKAAAGDACPDIDTVSAGLQASCVSLPKDTTFPVGISNIDELDRFSFYPNPTNGVANISFIAAKSTTYSARIVNIYGAEVKNEDLVVTAGLNNNTMDVSNLPNGVYIYTITDGKNVLTQRFVLDK